METQLRQGWVVPVIYCRDLRSNSCFFTLQATFPRLPCKLAPRYMRPMRDTKRTLECYCLREGRIILFFSTEAFRQCLCLFLASSFYNTGSSSVLASDLHLVASTINPASPKGLPLSFTPPGLVAERNKSTRNVKRSLSLRATFALILMAFTFRISQQVSTFMFDALRLIIIHHLF